MIHALGFSQTDFDPFSPGRLCRGRERWIEPWPREDDDADEPLTRLVITGAAFADDSARDARRGVTCAEVDPSELIRLLVAGERLVAFTEDGHPADIPDGAEGIELYEGYRAGGRVTLPLVRWYRVLANHDEIPDLIGEPNDPRVSGFAVIDKGVDLEALWSALFTLVGMSTLDSPPAKYQPAALHDVLEHARAVVMIHRDKHGPAIGLYSAEPLVDEAILTSFCNDAGRLLVPFAIPPMLARWDRALNELRIEWPRTHEEPFPVPRATLPSHWESRRNRRRDSDEQEVPSDQDDAVPTNDALDELLSTGDDGPRRGKEQSALEE